MHVETIMMTYVIHIFFIPVFRVFGPKSVLESQCLPAKANPEFCQNVHVIIPPSEDRGLGFGPIL